MTVKLSISLSDELAAVLDELANRRHEDRSPLVETLLREHILVQEGLGAFRATIWKTADSKAGNAAREKILNIVTAQPGRSISEISDKLALAWSTVDYHIRVLQRAGQIELGKDGRQQLAFPAGIADREKRNLIALADEDSQLVLESLLARSGQTVAELSVSLMVSNKVVRRHLSRLVDLGVVRRGGTVRPTFEVDGRRLREHRANGAPQ